MAGERGETNGDEMMSKFPTKIELAKFSKVKHPTLVITKDVSGQSLTAVLQFLRIGDAVSDAEDVAAGELRSDRQETFQFSLPDSFDVDDYGLYWNQVYIG